jgi:leader peptidase (prepilin peptidase)/N-methyltransferase
MIVLMIVAVLVVFGLCLGSFVNALVWRVHEQAHEQDKKKSDAKYLKSLSVSRGRSMCPNCKHELKAKDLVPVFSWLSLRGKCRYCRKPISVQYPLVELAMAGWFVASYLWWPEELAGIRVAIFVTWLVLSVGLMALLVYDVKWKLLPDRLMRPLSLVAALQAVLQIIAAQDTVMAIVNTVLAVAVGGGLFYILFQVSQGKWIGGGDVKLGWLLGLVAGTPGRSLLVIFSAALLGTLMSLPLLASHRLKRSSTIPFGPFLIIGLLITQLFGASILHWYTHQFLNF